MSAGESPRSWEDLPAELTLAEAAGIVRVHLNTFRLWRSRGMTPDAVRVGNTLRISKTALRRWYLAGRLGRKAS